MRKAGLSDIFDQYIINKESSLSEPSDIDYPLEQEMNRIFEYEPVVSDNIQHEQYKLIPMEN